jgi:hypothetical protein
MGIRLCFDKTSDFLGMEVNPPNPPRLAIVITGGFYCDFGNKSSGLSQSEHSEFVTLKYIVYLRDVCVSVCHASFEKRTNKSIRQYRTSIWRSDQVGGGRYQVRPQPGKHTNLT